MKKASKGEYSSTTDDDVEFSSKPKLDANSRVRFEHDLPQNESKQKPLDNYQIIRQYVQSFRGTNDLLDFHKKPSSISQPQQLKAKQQD